MAKLKRIEGAPVIVDPRPIAEIEREVYERATGGHNFLGWRAHGRDEDGHAVLACTVKGPTVEGVQMRKTQKVAITQEGLVYLRPEIHA